MQINSYKSADEYIKAGRNANYRSVKGNATRLVRRGSAIALEYQNTDVITYHRGGHTVALDRGGWLTRTTADRIDTYSPFRVKSGALYTTWAQMNPYREGRRYVRRGDDTWTIGHPGGFDFPIFDGEMIQVG